MIDTFDKTILEWFQSIQNDAATHFLSVLTKLGEAGILWIIAGLLMLIFLKEKKYGVIVLLSLLFCLIFGNGLLKNLVARQDHVTAHTTTLCCSQFQKIIRFRRDIPFLL